MPPRTPKFSPRDSLDVWQFIRLAPRSSENGWTRPRRDAAQSNPHRRGVARGGASASPADGAAPDDERPRLGRAALSECLKRAPVCACPLLWIALLLSSCGPHHPRPKVTRLLGTAPLHRGGALQADGERRPDPVNYSEGCRRPRWPRAACPSPCKHCG